MAAKTTIITCEGCGTKFRIRTSLLKAEGTPVRCSRCGVTFEARPPLPEKLFSAGVSDEEYILYGGPAPGKQAREPEPELEPEPEPGIRVSEPEPEKEPEPAPEPEPSILPPAPVVEVKPPTAREVSPPPAKETPPPPIKVPSEPVAEKEEPKAAKPETVPPAPEPPEPEPAPEPEKKPEPPKAKEAAGPIEPPWPGLKEPPRAAPPEPPRQPAARVYTPPPPPPAEETPGEAAVPTPPQAAGAVTGIRSRLNRQGPVTLIVLAVAAVFVLWMFLSRTGLLGGSGSADKSGVGQLSLSGMDESSGQFVKNGTDGIVYVVKGLVRNGFEEPRGAIRIKVTLYDRERHPVASKVVYAGNTLSPEELQTTPLAGIEARLSNPQGDGRSNVSVKPGRTLPFMAVFGHLPESLGEFSVEPAGSSPVASS